MPPTAVTPALPAARYTATAQLLHWLTTALILAILPLAWIADAMPRGAAQDWTWVLHRSAGLTVFALVVVRLLWRATHPAPRLPGLGGRVLEAVGRTNHWLLYALLVVMPVSGYLASSGGPVSYLGLVSLPAPPDVAWLADAADTVHVLGRLLVYALVLLHVAGVMFHVVIRRDGLLGRMLPPQSDVALRPAEPTT